MTTIQRGNSLFIYITLLHYLQKYIQFLQCTMFVHVRL